jgi:hypothetical protein
MDGLRKHRLYPLLAGLFMPTSYLYTSPEYLIGLLVKKIPPDELTVPRVLYEACWRGRLVVKSVNTVKMYELLRLARTESIDSDGYMIKYRVTFEQCWGGCVMDLARVGVTAVRNGDSIAVSYTHLPEISLVVKWPENAYSMKALAKHKSFISLVDDLGLYALQKKMVGMYATPYPEEVVMLRLIARLPQPIAESIEDCIRGVMERRFVEGISPALCYTSMAAVRAELRYTAYPVVINIKKKLRIEDRRQWEAIVVPMVAEVKIEAEKILRIARCQIDSATAWRAGENDW